MLPTFSLLLAFSALGINAGVIEVANQEAKHEVLPPNSIYAHCYYAPSKPALTQGQQLKALEDFAKNLLSKSQDNPQAVVDVLNRHFWELV